MAFCSKCGAELQPDAQFCPKCGQAVGQPAGPGPYDYMGRRDWRYKRRAARREARWDRRASPEWVLFNTVFGGLFAILIGGLLYMAASGVGGDLVTWSNFWTYLLMGFGGLLVIRGLISMLAWGYHGMGMIVGGMVLLVIGAAGLTESLGGWTQYIWIAIIVAGGLLIVLVGLLTYLFKK
jgi:hypothetical protein